MAIRPLGKAPVLFIATLLFISQYGVRSQSKCFGNDVGAASTNREVHREWAKKQDAAALKNGLKWKIEALYKCPGLTDEDLTVTFATLSVVVGDFSPNAACFGGDSGVLNREWSFHYRWAKGRSRSVQLASLTSKSTALIDCIDRQKQIDFYATMSFHIAWDTPDDDFP